MKKASSSMEDTLRKPPVPGTNSSNMTLSSDFGLSSTSDETIVVHLTPSSKQKKRKGKVSRGTSRVSSAKSGPSMAEQFLMTFNFAKSPV